MKKLFKAVALATVMCMLLSTAAFANYGTAVGDKATKLITANVLSAGENEQVVLLIVDKDVKDLATVAEADIMYIDQKQADAKGAAKFENIAIKDTETIVDIYVGSAKTDGPQLIGNDIDVTNVKEITLATNLGDDAIITAHSNNGVTKGFAAAIAVNIPEGLTVSKMIWGFKLVGEENRRYSTAYAPEGADHLSGTVQFAAAFDLGDAVVENVSAIFFTGDPESEEDKNDPTKTHYTHEELDSPYKKKAE